MSGGRFDYIDSRCKSEIFGWDDKCRNVFEDREISELIFDVFDLIHDYDWYASGDTSEGMWLTTKDAFKKKWLKRDNERVKRIIDNAIDEAREELYKTYGVPQTEPLLTCSVNGRPYSECSSCEHFKCTADEPQTDCAWGKGE